jgi:thiol-disulfide isomerase/thioredoxin
LVVRAGSCAFLAVLCVAPCGCSLVKKITKNQTSEPRDSMPPPQFPTGGTPQPAPAAAGVTPTTAVSNPGNQGAILAGRVIDGFMRPPGNTSIRWVNLDDKKETENEVSVTPEGYFTIQGLKPNGHYKLVARGKQGDRTIAGTQFVTAPNIRVLIQVKEEFVNSSTPSAPASPGAGASTDNKTSSLGTNPNGWSIGPVAALPGKNANEPDLPVAINVGPGRSPGNPSQDWTPAPPATWPPVLEIPGRKPPPPPPPLQIPVNPGPGGAAPVGAAPGLPNPPAFPASVHDALSRALVPSCVRVGDRVVNFALNELNGQPWEFRYRKSKLVLVDFWRTDCPPCLQSLPFLNGLQSKYGAQGLEVIGIANESEGNAQEQAYRVMAICKRYNVNYRQLLSTAADCPVRNEFRIRYVPTMVLLDEQGRIIWRADGPTPDQKAELERAINQRLAPRAF